MYSTRAAVAVGRVVGADLASEQTMPADWLVGRRGRANSALAVGPVLSSVHGLVERDRNIRWVTPRREGIGLDEGGGRGA